MKSTEHAWLVLALPALVLMSSCMTTSEATDRSGAAHRVCINTGAVTGFDALGEKYVYIREGTRRHFLLTMRTRCLNLRDAQSIVISSATARVCERGFGKIVYSDGMSGQGMESCHIEMVESVGSKAHAKAVVAARTGLPSEQNQGTWTELPEPE